MIGTLVQKGSPVRSYLLPFSVGGLALTVSILGAMTIGADNTTGGINGFIEGLSGSSSSGLGDIGVLAPLGFAFAAGMVSTVNPCGFAMLPAYLGLYIGSNDAKMVASTAVQKLAQALLVGLVVTSGFVINTSRARLPDSTFWSNTASLVDSRLSEICRVFWRICTAR